MKTLRALFALCLMGLLAACASPTGESAPRVHVVGLEPLVGQGLELRMLVKLRVINPGEKALDYDGIALDMDVHNKGFASGVSDAKGTVPRFGEAVLSVPVSVSAVALLRQAMGMAQGTPSKVAYELRGRLAGTTWGTVRFQSSGEIELPTSLPR